MNTSWNYFLFTAMFAVMIVAGQATVVEAQQLPPLPILISGGGNLAGDSTPKKLLEQDVLELINKERQQSNLEPLVWSAKAAEVARMHSRDMGWNKYFSHKSLDGRMVTDRADGSGLADWSMIGENIAMVGGFADPVDHVVNGWMHSDGHRKNILDPRWKETGIGIFITSEGTYYFTQVFLTRK
jgi:uncharacterized protein YkwD